MNINACYISIAGKCHVIQETKALNCVLTQRTLLTELHWISREWGNVRENNYITRSEMNSTLQKLQVDSIRRLPFTQE